jgi:tetratricopeptide (TPR) repeat protein
MSMVIPGSIRSLLDSRFVLFFLLTLGSGQVALRAQSPAQSVDSYLSQAAKLEQGGDYAGAEKVYLDAAKEYPRQSEIIKRLGIVYQTQLKFPQSIEAFQHVLEQAPQYPEVNFYMGLSYFGLNQLDKAVEFFDKELAANPKYRRARFYEAQAFRAMNRNADALRQYEILLEQDSGDKQALYQLIRFLKSTTLQAIDELANLDQNSDYILVLRAESHVSEEKYPEAIHEYKQVLAKNPQFPGVHFALGEAYYNNVDYPNAEKELRLALSEDPNHPMANYYLADIMIKSDRTVQAIPLLEIVVTAVPNFMKGFFLLGKCYASQGKLDDAVKLLEKAAVLDPDDKNVHYQLAQIYTKLKQPEKSREHMQQFQKLYAQERAKKNEKLEGFHKMIGDPKDTSGKSASASSPKEQ